MQKHARAFENIKERNLDHLLAFLRLLAKKARSRPFAFLIACQQ